MGILLAFAPFIAFAAVDRLSRPIAGLAAGAIVSIGLLARDWLTPGRSPKTLEIGTTFLFTGLTLYAALGPGADWSVIGVRLCVDGGLLLIVLISMAIGRPFTLEYARERVSSEYWNNPEFRRVNYVITAIWAAAFAVMVIAEAALLYVPDLSPRIGIIVIVLALIGAVKFTGWYPERAKSRTTS
jgi:hypothetical protein